MNLRQEQPERPFRRPWRALKLLLSVPLVFATLVQAQDTAPTPKTLEEALHQLSDAAGVIFVGEVIAIRHLAGGSAASGVVEIDFRVDQAVRGCPTGGIYMLREWAGLWSGGDQRYRVGQRLLMLLHTPGAAGMSSPVGGMDGAIPIRGGATAIKPQSQTANAVIMTASSLTVTAAAATTPAPPVADLRWVGTRVQRTISYAASPQSAFVATAQIAPATNTRVAPDTSIASSVEQQAAVPVVVDMLISWQGMHGAQ